MVDAVPQRVQPYADAAVGVNAAMHVRGDSIAGDRTVEIVEKGAVSGRISRRVSLREVHHVDEEIQRRTHRPNLE